MSADGASPQNRQRYAERIKTSRSDRQPGQNQSRSKGPDSSSQCNILQEDLEGCAEAEYFRGSVVQFMDNLLEFLR